jgi:hypothetical protein
MPLVWVGTDEDPLWYRPPYRPEDDRIDPNTLRGVEARSSTRRWRMTSPSTTIGVVVAG